MAPVLGFTVESNMGPVFKRVHTFTVGLDPASDEIKIVRSNKDL
jgi:hypothetical protein